MNRLTLASFAWALIASQARAADAPPPELATLCREVFCRTPQVRLMVDAQRVYEQRMEAPLPVLLPNGWVSVYPGETVYVEAQLEGTNLKLLRAVPKPEKLETTLELKFEQLPAKPDMMLTVSNPFPVAVRFRMGFMRPDSDRLLRTSSCPVLGGKKLFEHWPHAIFQLVVTDPQVLAEGDDLSCK